MKYDLNLYSVTYRDGLLQPRTPGLYAWAAPKRVARGRQDDLLFLSLIIKGGKSFSQQERTELVNKISGEFFHCSGSVTNAMRVVIDMINIRFLERNLKLVEDCDRISADLWMGVIHYDTLIAVQCGISHGFLITRNGLTHFFDPEVGERGLGLSRMPRMKYFQEVIQDEAFLVLSSEPPQSWSSELLFRDEPTTLELLIRRLHHQISKQHVGGLIHILSGSGRINWFDAEGEETPATIAPISVETPREVTKEVPVPKIELPAYQVTASQEVEETQVPRENPLKINESIAEKIPPTNDGIIYKVSPSDDFYEEEETTPADDKQATQVIPSYPEVARVIGPGKEDLTQSVNQEELETSKAQAKVDQSEKITKVKNSLLHSLAKFFTSLHITEDKARNFLSKLAKQQEVKPDTSLSKGRMILIAIIVPIVIVAIAVSIYLSRGKERQYQLYLELGQAAASNAQVFTDPTAQRNAWTDALNYANMAISYNQTGDADALKRQASIALDSLDGAVRLVYQPAYSADEIPDLRITKIIPFATDVYLLDAYSAQVLRLTLGTKGYQLSSDFACSKGTYNGISVGNIVDMVSIPQSNAYKAPILALDSDGNIIYCAHGRAPVAFSLKQPDAGIGQINSAAYNSNSGTLYLLDALHNEIWIYQGFSSEFTKAGIPYFEEFPHDVRTAVDFDTNGDELYLLYTDGHMSRCISSGIEGIDLKCTDPEIYKDARTGVQGFDFSTLKYTQLNYSGPLDPSLYLLSPSDIAVYQFSVLLNLNRIYRSEFDVLSIDGKQVTAFAISSNRSAYLAFGNRLLYAIIP